MTEKEKSTKKESLDSKLINAFVGVTSGNKIETIWEDVFIVKTHNIEENGKQTVIVQEIPKPKLPTNLIVPAKK